MRLPLRQLLLLSLVLGMASPCVAGSTNSLTLHTDLPDVGVSAIRALGALAFVLALFLGGVWLFRNGQRVVWRKTGSPRLAILESRPLGNRIAVHVVGYENQRLLIGSSPAGLNLLSQLPPCTTEPEPAPEAPSLAASFADQLQTLLKRK